MLATSAVSVKIFVYISVQAGACTLADKARDALKDECGSILNAIHLSAALRVREGAGRGASHSGSAD